MPETPVTYTVDDARRLVEITIREGFTHADIMTCFSALRSDPRIRPEYHRLALYEGTAVPFTSAEVRAMVEAAARVPHTDRTCVAVLARTDLLFGMMRMYEMYGEGQGIHVRVFRERADAERWLAGCPR